MSQLVDAFEVKLLNGLTGKTQLTTPTTVYMALFSADPTDTGSVVNELVGNGYTRTALTGKFPLAVGTGGTVSNDVAITSATATADWTTVTHVGFMESGTSTTDDMMLLHVLDSPITVLNTEPFEYAIGDCTINTSGLLTDAWEIKLLNGLTGASPLTTPATVYKALFSADPTSTGSVVSELVGNGYTRTALTAKYPTATGTDGTVANDAVIDSSTATADWLEVAHEGFMESGVTTTDDMMIVVTLDAPITILNTQKFSNAIGTSTITVA